MDYIVLAQKFLYIFIPFLVALSFHELAHAVVAQIRGDNTARLMGRVSMNPFSHVDLVGTLILPLALLLYSTPFFFGWGKPVPVTREKLRFPRWDTALIALAGPLANVFLALLTVVLLGLFYPMIYGSTYQSDFLYFSHFFVRLNLYLAVFNLLPFNPLDGGKILGSLLPENWARWLEQQQMLVSAALFLLVLGGGLGFLVGPVTDFADFLIGQATGGI